MRKALEGPQTNPSSVQNILLRAKIAPDPKKLWIATRHDFGSSIGRKESLNLRSAPISNPRHRRRDG
jgi:hypothetical protein